jgi:phage major head subunit gpT-like protein
MQVTQSNLTNLFKGFKTTYLESYQAAKAVWDQIAMRVPSMAKSETYHWLGAIPGMRELVGSVVIQNVTSHNFSILNKEWENTIAVKQLDIETDSYGIYSPLFSTMGLVSKQHPDDLVAKLLVEGFTLTDYTGSAFFGTAKKRTAEDAGFTNSTNKKFSQTNYRAARTSLMGRKNAQGRSMKLGQKLLLVVTPTDEPAAREILVAERSANGATNIDRNTAELLVLPELENYTANAADKPWFLLETGLPVRAIILQSVKDPVLTALDRLDSDTVFHEHEFRYQAYGIYNVGYGLPELAYGSSGTNAA